MQSVLLFLHSSFILSEPRDDARYFQISVPMQPGNSGGVRSPASGRSRAQNRLKSELQTGARAALAARGALPENVNYAVRSWQGGAALMVGLRSNAAPPFLESVPEVSAKLKEPETKEWKFEDVVKSAKQATVLVLVY